MFDFFRKGGPSPRQIEKTVKRLSESHGEQAPRIEAAQRLVEWGSPEAIFGLLKRFTVSSRVITQDIEEKQMVVGMLVEQGDKAVAPILRFLRTYQQVDWPIRALTEILPRDEFVRSLVEIIEQVGQSEFTSPEHRVSLIRGVHGHVTPEIARVLRHVLADRDDDVRIAAIEALVEVGDEMREPLLEAFIYSDDRPRIRLRIAEIFADREWPVRGYRPKVEESLPNGFYLTSKGIRRRK